jgi:hypothetical protein
MNQEFCPSLADLFADPMGAEVRAHIADCVRCQTLSQHRETQRKEGPQIGSWEAVTRVQPLLNVDVGALVSVRVPTSDEFLVAAVVEAATEEIVIAAISAETEFAAEWDLLIDRSVLGYPASIEVWNSGTVLIEQLHEILGQVPTDVWQQLDLLYEASLLGRQPLEAVPTGPPVIAERDPRLLFQEQELERSREAWLPASALAPAGSLIELLDSRLDALRLDWEEVSERLSDEVANRPDWVTLLRRRQLDIFASVQVQAMKRLLATLELPPSRRLASFVWREVAKTRQVEAKTGLAFARRRLGQRTPKRNADDESAREAADRYVQKLMDSWTQ